MPNPKFMPGLTPADRKTLEHIKELLDQSHSNVKYAPQLLPLLKAQETLTTLIHGLVFRDLTH